MYRTYSEVNRVGVYPFCCIDTT